MSRLLSEKGFDSGETVDLNVEIIRNLSKSKFSQGIKANGDDYSSTLRLSVCYNPVNPKAIFYTLSPKPLESNPSPKNRRLRCIHSSQYDLVVLALASEARIWSWKAPQERGLDNQDRVWGTV